ncbi:hypothetical protein BCV70DRAFT_200161 [Testicularia cyperi]|uniref:Uncharacterized protein n=1 Tax=Testicularia cyperi TaxID=1882483 RepID=A0A317XQ23_9BASI|nr:hypothetical protein BCV70DRAFT_200161 [Testicularia cyperi]
MEPILPPPLRLQLSHEPVSVTHDEVSASISAFLSAYAARTGAQTSSNADDPSSAATGSTGGVVASQLTRLMNGLAGKIDYDVFSKFVGASGFDTPKDTDDEYETPAEVLESTSQPSTSAAIADSALPSQPPAPKSEQGVDGTVSFSRSDELHADSDIPDPTSLISSQPDADAKDNDDKKRKKDKKEKKEKKEKKSKHEGDEDKESKKKRRKSSD